MVLAAVDSDCSMREVWRALQALTPIAQVPLDWDATGYTSDTFNEEAQSDSFDGWDGDLDTEDEAAVIAHLLDVKRGESLLDIACGYGRHDLILAGKHGLHVTGVDISPGLIATAKNMATAQGLDITYEVGHGKDLRGRNTFDHAMIGFNSFSVFSPQDAAAVLRAIHQALKPGGNLFLDLDNKPFNCRYGTCYRNWYSTPKGVILQDVHFHHDQSVEIMRDVTILPEFEGLRQFICLKRIYEESEIRKLLSSCGFRVEHVYGNWDLTPLTDSSPKIILLITREL